MVPLAKAAADSPPAWVGRVSAAAGTVALRATGADWTAAEVNSPVAAGMSARTGTPGRAVLRIGAEAIALSDGAEIDLARLDADGVQIVLRQGRIGVRLSPEAAAHGVEIATARGGLWLKAAGAYDIAAGDEHRPARIAAVNERAPVSGDQIDTVSAAGFTTEPNDGGHPVAASPGAAADDEFVAWWRTAAGDAANRQAAQYLSPAMTGYDALAGNGSWETVDGYGAVWFPAAVSHDWAPYRHGHWRWIAPWGWNWIDDMPWGFAPSHYGRWAYIAGADPGTERWGWVPGDRVAEPVYAPALVAFLGTPGVGLSYPDASGPAVAWFPLAPGEVYWPGYTNDLAVIRRINDGTVADIAALEPGIDGAPPAAVRNGDYRNRRFASVVPRGTFVAGRPVATAVVDLPRKRLDDAPLLAGSPQIGPPAPRAVAVAASAAAHRLADAAGSRVAHAVQTLTRVLRPHVEASAVRNATPGRRPAVRRDIRVAARGHWRAPGKLSARPHVIVAAAAHTLRPRFAAAHHHLIR